MKQELLDSIKRHYEDYTTIIEKNFSELDDKLITPGRKKLVESIKALYHKCLEEYLDIDESVLSEAINNVLGTNENIKTNIGKTNGIIMYMGTLEYDTYIKLLGIELGNKYPNKSYNLYMDIENNKMYFVTEERRKAFEKKHKTIVTYKNPNCSDGWNFERNYHELPAIRREFIKQAMYTGQEEATIQFVKKYSA